MLNRRRLLKVQGGIPPPGRRLRALRRRQLPRVPAQGGRMPRLPARLLAPQRPGMHKVSPSLRTPPACLCHAAAALGSTPGLCWAPSAPCAARALLTFPPAPPPQVQGPLRRVRQRDRLQALRLRLRPRRRPVLAVRGRALPRLRRRHRVLHALRARRRVAHDVWGQLRRVEVFLRPRIRCFRSQ